MTTLILHPTTIAHWYALVNEAQVSSAIQLQEDLASYLVFLLHRFTANTDIASSVLGLDFLKSYQQVSSRQELKDVGDKCLLVAGLFPGRAIKRRVKLSYFVKLGQTAYSTLSNHVVDQEELFNQLCYEFPKLLDVLLAMRESSLSAVDLLQTLELWHETGSRTAWKRLRQISPALPITRFDKKLLN